VTRLKCPVSNCQKDTSNIARLWDHFRGTHVNNSDFINLIKLISESPKIDNKLKKLNSENSRLYI
jgi:hypothetical protein